MEKKLNILWIITIIITILVNNRLLTAIELILLLLIININTKYEQKNKLLLHELAQLETILDIRIFNLFPSRTSNNKARIKYLYDLQEFTAKWVMKNK